MPAGESESREPWKAVHSLPRPTIPILQSSLSLCDLCEVVCHAFVGPERGQMCAAGRNSPVLTHLKLATLPRLSRGTAGTDPDEGDRVLWYRH